MLRLTFKSPHVIRVRRMLTNGDVANGEDEWVSVAAMEVEFTLHAGDVIAASGADIERRKPTDPKTPPSTSERIYEPHKGEVTEELARAFSSGKHDSRARDAKLVGDLVAVLGWLRKRLFNLQAATVTKNEVEALKRALSDNAPSLFCKAVVAASRDDFWKKNGDIRVTAIIGNLGSLTSAKRAAARKDWLARLRDLMPSIEIVDPVSHAEIRSALDGMSQNEAQSLFEKWSKK